ILHLFLFTAPPTPELYTLSLHDALPISIARLLFADSARYGQLKEAIQSLAHDPSIAVRSCAISPLIAALNIDSVTAISWFVECVDRKSTRLNSSHRTISYAVFCLKKKKQ